MTTLSIDEIFQRVFMAHGPSCPVRADMDVMQGAIDGAECARADAVEDAEADADALQKAIKDANAK